MTTSDEPNGRAERALLAALDDLADYGVVVADASGKFEHFTKGAERIVGLGSTDTTPDEWAKTYGVFLPDTVTPFPGEDQPLARAIRGEPTNGVEVFIRNSNVPRGVWLSVSGRPIRTADGGLAGGIVVFHDISQIKKKDDQLRQGQKMEAIGRLAGGVAHDFNNLMTAVVGYGELILARLSANDPMRAQIEEIKKAGEKASTLTRQLLAFSRKQILKPTIVNVNAIVNDIEKMLRRILGEDVDLVVKLDRALGNVKADPSQIEQVIVNLAVNGRDAMPHGGRLIIETANVELDETYTRLHPEVSPGPHVMLAVSDTGTGMSGETLSRLFEPFFTTKEQGKGTGLGLSTVYGIVKQSGGSVFVYSEPGRGTVFKVYFPRVAEEVPSPTIVTGPPAKVRGSETVLLVEDEDVVRKLARTILGMHGYNVLEAANGGEALLLSERFGGTIHLMLTDVVLPQMSGKELADRLGPSRPAMKVLYMSGYTENAIVHHGAVDDGTAFMQKPFTPGQLAAKVREVIDRPQERSP